MNIEDVNSSDYLELLAVWEDAVRATHDFLSEEDIQSFKPMILEHAFPAVILKCVKSEQGAIIGFIGVHKQKIEMLFVKNSVRGQGVGKRLLQYAINELQCNKVDVNEQNPQALGFYQYCGFAIISRSPLDDAGKPFPILHLKLIESATF